MLGGDNWATAQADPRRICASSSDEELISPATMPFPAVPAHIDALLRFKSYWGSAILARAASMFIVVSMIIMEFVFQISRGPEEGVGGEL